MQPSSPVKLDTLMDIILVSLVRIDKSVFVSLSRIVTLASSIQEAIARSGFAGEIVGDGEDGEGEDGFGCSVAVTRDVFFGISVF